MTETISSDRIHLRQRNTTENAPQAGAEHVLTLTEKLNELFGKSYQKDDIYGMIIPLLMQGKVRVDLDDQSERLELEDQTHRQTRSEAIHVFEQYLQAYGHGATGSNMEATQRVSMRRGPFGYKT